MPDLVQKKFTIACKDFFGFHPGQTLQEFAAEIKALSAQDRADFVEMFKTIGVEITN